jgi:hypothetical protein
MPFSNKIHCNYSVCLIHLLKRIFSMKSLICAFALVGFAARVSSSPIEPLAQKWVAQ